MKWLKRIIGGHTDAERSACETKSPKFSPMGCTSPVFSRTKVVSVQPETLSKNKVIIDEDSRVAEQFKILRTLIFSRTRPQSWSTIQITGFDPGEGKSLVAANLALSIARDSRQTTLLVDLDFRNPSIHSFLGLDPELPGLMSYFAAEKGLEDILISPGIEKLTVLPAGGRVMQAPELIGSPAMEAMVKELKGRYADRYIIFDTPPMNGYPDALVFAEYVDAIILVARAGHTFRSSVESLSGLVPREKVLGVIFNDFSSRDSNGKYGRR